MVWVVEGERVPECVALLHTERVEVAVRHRDAELHALREGEGLVVGETQLVGLVLWVTEVVGDTLLVKVAHWVGV